MTVSNSPSSGYNLNYTAGATIQSGSATLGAITSGTGTLVPSTSQSCSISATSTNLGVNTIALTASDPNSSNLSQATTATLTVLDHAAAAFVGGGGTLNLCFGTVQRGTSSLQFQIENLSEAYRAGLALNSVTALSDPGGVFSTEATLFSDLAPGTDTGPFDLLLSTSQLGDLSGQFQLNLSDEQDLSGWAGQQTLTLNVTADVVPEPSTLFLLCGAAIGLLVCGLRKRVASTRGLNKKPDRLPPLSGRHQAELVKGRDHPQFIAPTFLSSPATPVLRPHPSLPTAPQSSARPHGVLSHFLARWHSRVRARAVRSSQLTPDSCPSFT